MKQAVIALSVATAGLAVVALAPRAGADNTDTGNVTVNGTIVAPLTISPNANLVKPHIVRPSAGEPPGEVVLTCDSVSDANNTVSYSNRSNPFAHGVSTVSNQGPQTGSVNKTVGGANFTGSCATLTVSGQGSYNYIPTISPLTPPTAVGVSVTGLNCRENGTTVSTGVSRQLPAGGSTTVRCGATVTVSSASTATTYNDGTFTISVTYD
jgi:hypothetical protein